jgi:MoaA/NifB/PqqE/SkfB family radical SAM enzyme
MIKSLTKIFKRDHQDYDSFQIEVSTYNPLECQVCPRAAFAEQWNFQNMPMETFQRIGRYFHLTQWVSFCGWGEPMENDTLLPMLRLAKDKGCLVGLTTNGIHLTEDLSNPLLSAGLDLLVVSLEWAAQGIQESLATGSEFKKILDQVEGFIQIRNKHHRKTPAVKLSFPMTRINMPELSSLVPLAAKLGVDEVIFHNLDYLPDERWNILRTFYHESPTPAFQESIDGIRRLGRELSVPVSIYPLKVEEQLVCEPNPPRNVFFSVDGSVAPCPYLRIPKKGDIPRIFMNKETVVPQTFFGNIQEEDFIAVWNKEPYKKFRGIFEERKKAETNTAQLFDTFSNISSSSLEKAIPKEPPPLSERCQTCYKAYGV